MWQERWYPELDFAINKSLQKENWQDKRKANSRWTIQPFGLTETGKIDFRGFPFREPLHYHYLRGMDFSHSVFLSETTEGYGMSRGQSGIAFSLFEECNFTGAVMPANLSERFVNCDFSHTIFDHTRMNGVFERCSFARSKLSSALVGGTFSHCDFHKANLRRTAFHGVRFDACCFDEANFSWTNISGNTFIRTQPAEQQIQVCALAEKVRYLDIERVARPPAPRSSSKKSTARSLPIKIREVNFTANVVNLLEDEAFWTFALTDGRKEPEHAFFLLFDRRFQSMRGEEFFQSSWTDSGEYGLVRKIAVGEAKIIVTLVLDAVELVIIGHTPDCPYSAAAIFFWLHNVQSATKSKIKLEWLG